MPPRPICWFVALTAYAPVSSTSSQRNASPCSYTILSAADKPSTVALCLRQESFNTVKATTTTPTDASILPGLCVH